MISLPFSDEARTDALRAWFAVALGSLLLAGFFSLFLVIGRAPGLNGFFEDPLFFRRCLVVHVNLALVVWFYAFLAGLYTLLPGAATSVAPALVAAVGVVLLVAGGGVREAVPVLSNYVPMIDHPVFASGLVLVGLGVSAQICLGLARGSGVEDASGFPPGARTGLRAAGIAFVIAVLTFLGAWASTPTTLDPEYYYELLFWGGGHVLQFASVAAMIAIWLVLLEPVVGRPITGRRLNRLLFGALLLPLPLSPVVALLGTESALYRVGFTRLMQWGIFPVTTSFIVLSSIALVRKVRSDGLPVLLDARVVGFAASAALTLVGFVLGAMIRGSNTMIPAHYHAAIGAVTVAFMAVTYVLLPLVGLPLSTARLRRISAWQPALFGGGQLVFALGFGLAGANGMGRKVYGQEQQVAGLSDWAGLALMGLGGLAAMAGGLLFLGILAAAWRARPTASDQGRARRLAWRTTGSIPSRS